jgi:hypothetical protein
LTSPNNSTLQSEDRREHSIIFSAVYPHAPFGAFSDCGIFGLSRAWLFFCGSLLDMFMTSVLEGVKGDGKKK